MRHAWTFVGYLREIALMRNGNNMIHETKRSADFGRSG